MNSPNNLHLAGLVEVAPSLPIILCEWVLDGDNWVLAGELLVLVGELLVGNPLALVTFGVLEVQVVLLGIGVVELAGGDIHGNLDLSSVASLLDSIRDELKSLIGGLNVWSDTTLITDVASGLTVLLLGESLELLVHLGTLAHGLGESLGISVSGELTMRITCAVYTYRSLGWHNHELLESQATTGV